jgi:hypothetical protein
MKKTQTARVITSRKIAALSAELAQTEAEAANKKRGMTDMEKVEALVLDKPAKRGPKMKPLTDAQVAELQAARDAKKSSKKSGPSNAEIAEQINVARDKKEAAKQAAKLAKAAGKATTKAAAKLAAAQLTAPAPTEPVAPAAGDRDPSNKRVIVGTPTNEWRIRRSQRTSFTGYFLQGGIYQVGPKGNEFVVGYEERFKALEAAQEALEAKQPKAEPVAAKMAEPAQVAPKATGKKKASK